MIRSHLLIYPAALSAKKLPFRGKNKNKNIKINRNFAKKKHKLRQIHFDKYTKKQKNTHLRPGGRGYLKEFPWDSMAIKTSRK